MSNRPAARRSIGSSSTHRARATSRPFIRAGIPSHSRTRFSSEIFALYPRAPVPSNLDKLRQLYAAKPVVLAPLEDVSDVVFRRLCRSQGAEITVTEFVNVEGLLRGCRNARRKIRLADDDVLTAIQIYGSDPE